MRHSGPLRIVPDFSFPFSKVVISPHEGVDLGYISACYSVRFYVNVSLDAFSRGEGDGIQAQLFLDHSCKQGTVEISRALWEKLGKPRQAVLVADDTGQKVLFLTKKPE
ncbi:hypothetical protein Spith_0428 [Spirochaeta thermophila DSM 6578]|uniref:Uncharacterized protein n=1 Tax=Winmispira thermophila (strain ATCC 700085 / DSM 6578 / Z-1203) TaxID=869211 RepID=G0GEM4_WINT7|nr:hypothetical protein [Spirochaeta thermophila]AEJ60712.1 hypothetical protein Spith_0428 [Spirochaeta thermophila DSM 6578]